MPSPVDAGQVRPDRAGPGGDHEVLEADAERAVAGQVADLDLAPVGVDLDDLVLGPHVDAHRFAELARRAGDERLDVLDLAGDVVRDAAGRVAHPATPLEGHDLEVRAEPAGVGRGGHATRVASDDDQPLSHGGRGYRGPRPGPTRVPSSKSGLSDCGHGRAQGLPPLLHPEHDERRPHPAVPRRRRRAGPVRLSRSTACSSSPARSATPAGSASSRPTTATAGASSAPRSSSTSARRPAAGPALRRWTCALAAPQVIAGSCKPGIDVGERPGHQVVVVVGELPARRSRRAAPAGRPSPAGLRSAGAPRHGRARAAWSLLVDVGRQQPPQPRGRPHRRLADRWRPRRPARRRSPHPGRRRAARPSRRSTQPGSDATSPSANADA